MGLVNGSRKGMHSGTMRIIGGEYRGRILKMPKAVNIRPTQDRVREAVFNIIRASVPGSDVLDLYAASGAFGIEALSRGAHSSIFVDNNSTCVKTIKVNLSTLGDKCPFSQVLKLDAIMAISRFRKENRKFDIIFLDPPYYKGLAKNSLIKIDACDILALHGFVVAEHFIRDSMPEEAGNLVLFKQKKYGDTVITLYRV